MEGEIQFNNEPKKTSIGKIFLIVFLIILVSSPLIYTIRKAVLDVNRNRDIATEKVKEIDQKQTEIIQNIKNNTQQNITTNFSEKNNTTNQTQKNIIEDIEKNVFSFVPITDKNTFENDCNPWKNELGVNFGINGYYAEIKADPAKDKEASNQVDNYFIKNGFTKNIANTFDGVAGGTEPGRTVGYENGITKCTISWTIVKYPKDLFFISCGVADTINNKNFNTFYTLLGKPSDFCVKSNNDKFAKGIVKNSTSSSFNQDTWLAKYIDGVWSIIWKGGDISTIPCSLVKEFPRDFYTICK